MSRHSWLASGIPCHVQRARTELSQRRTQNSSSGCLGLRAVWPSCLLHSPAPALRPHSGLSQSLPATPTPWWWSRSMTPWALGPFATSSTQVSPPLPPPATGRQHRAPWHRDGDTGHCRLQSAGSACAFHANIVAAILAADAILVADANKHSAATPGNTMGFPFGP